MKRYVLTKPAAQDIAEIKTYLVAEAGVLVALRVSRDLRAAMEFLGDSPAAGHYRQDLTDQPVKFWSVFSYLIIYDPEKRPIEVIRVLHGARDIEE